MNKATDEDHGRKRLPRFTGWLSPINSSSPSGKASPHTSQSDLLTPESAAATSKHRGLFSRRSWHSSQQNKSRSPYASSLSLSVSPEPPESEVQASASLSTDVKDATEAHTTTVNETNKRALFKRDSKRAKDNELKMLHYSYIMSESASLREAVKLAHSLTETTQTGPTAQDCVKLAEISCEYIAIVIDYKQTFRAVQLNLESLMSEIVGVLYEIQKRISSLPQLSSKTVDDWKSDKVVTDQCRLDLQSVISRSQQKYPALARKNSGNTNTIQDSAARNSLGVVSSVLGTSIFFLEILKEAAEIAPDPILKGCVGTILMLLQIAETTRSNREDMLELANIAEDFVASIWEACQGSNEALSEKFQSAVDSLAKVLLDILEKCQAFSNRSLLSRVIGQKSDKSEIVVCKEKLQNAINKFQVTTQVLQQHALDAILLGQKNLIETTHATLLETLPHAAISFEDGDYVATTRTEIMEAISEWIENPKNHAQVFWLHGAAGMGKSTITRRLRAVLGEGGRLAGHFFFQRQSTEQERPDFVIGTLAYQLAHAQKNMSTAIVDAIEHPAVDQLFLTRFRSLILEPLKKGKFALPTVILLDALDEYKDATKLLDVLVTLISQFPPHIKLFITSRPEASIRSRVEKLGAQQWELRSASHAAIKSIFEHRFQMIDGWKQYPTTELLSQLVELADGLPVWAATACTFIAEFSPGHPDLPLRKVLESQSSHRRAAESALDALYNAALEHICPKVVRGPDLQAENFRLIFGSIYVINASLTLKDIEVLLGEDEPVESVMRSLSSLHARASSSFTSATLITPAVARFHASFIEFIVDTQRCMDARFRLDIAQAHENVARACLRLMDEMFRSGSGCYPESYASLSGAHLYAVNNWAMHVSHNTKSMSGDLHAALSNFCQRHFLAWFKLQFESVTGSLMSQEIAKGYNSKIFSHLAADRLCSFVTLILYMQQMGHPVDIVHLNMAISVQSIVVHMIKSDDLKMVIYRAIFGSLLMSRYKQSGVFEDIENAIDHYRQALAICAGNSPHRSPLLHNLAVALLARVDGSWAKRDVDEMIDYFVESHRLLPNSASDLVRALSLDGRATAYNLRFTISQERDDLAAALSLHRRALKMCKRSDRARAEFSNNLAHTLELRFHQTASSNDLDEVISLRQEALRLLHETLIDKNALPGNIAIALRTHSGSNSDDSDDLYNNIPLCRQNFTIHLTSYLTQSSVLRSLAGNLQTRFDRYRGSDDLDESVRQLQVVELDSSADHVDRAKSIDILGLSLYNRFKQSGRMEDLDQAISLFQQVLVLCPLGHPNHPDCNILYSNLGFNLFIRFEFNHRIEDLDEAVLHLTRALELYKIGDPSRAFPLNNLGNVLGARYKLFGRAEDLDDSISFFREALEHRPLDHSGRARSLAYLGSALLTRYDNSAQAEDMDRAISLYRQAVELCPPGHADRASSLSNLGAALYARSGQNDGVEDRDESISLLRQAVGLFLPGERRRGCSFHDLGKALFARFKQSDTVEDLDESIFFLRQALELHPPGHSDYSSTLDSLTSALQARYKKLGKADDLTEATSLLSQTPPDREPGRGDSLDDTILLLRQTLELCPPGHPDHARSLNNLGNALHARFRQSGNFDDLAEAGSLFRQAPQVAAVWSPSA